MTFVDPAFAWGFVSLAGILALYLLKRKYEIRKVPSTFLWQKAQKDLSVSRPFQRLKRNILLPLQLLMAAALTLGLMRPMVPGGMGGEVVMIFDLSASMQARENGRTRLEEAVDVAEGLIAGLSPQDALTILTASDETRQVLSRSTDRQEAYRVLSSLRPSNGECDLSQAISVAKAMKREIGEMNMMVFSDDYTPEEGISAYNAQKGLSNRAVVSFTLENGQGYARVANFGEEADVTLGCYAEGELCDARTLRLGAGETAGVMLSVPPCRWAYVQIQEEDAIQTDNTLYHVSKLQNSYTVALAGEGSVFLERAIELRDDIQLVRTTEEEMPAIAADVYVYGQSPLYFSLDAQQAEIAAGEETTPAGKLTIARESKLTSGLTLSDVAVRAYRPLAGGTVYLTLDGQSVMAGNGRTVAIGLDIHDTNLPMKYDFPILIQNILQNLLPEMAADIGDGLCGREIAVPLPADGGRARITLPSGKTVSTEDMTQWSGTEWSEAFSDTDEAGLYTLTIEEGRSASERYFAMRMPLSQSDVRSVAPSVDAEGEGTAFERGMEWTGCFAAAFLVLLLIEWAVRRRAV